jgi:photosystem II stability/assembly factor-like uncharacterized protein
MAKHYLLGLSLLILLSVSAWRMSETLTEFSEERTEQKEEAQEAEGWFESWYGQRAYPNDYIDLRQYQAAYRYSKSQLIEAQRGGDTSAWRSIGPDNVGGRTRALAFNPQTPTILWAGAASGGLWRSTTAGVGANAWTRIETGFPSVSVSSIVINPQNPNEMYIGTGEFRRYAQPGMIGTPGARGTYGIGILKSTNGGTTWTQTGLVSTLDQFFTVQQMRLDPLNPQTLYAATSEGVFKTTNGGTTWTQSLTTPAAMDIVLNPRNPNVVYASCGQLNSAPNPGLYKTTDAGATWTLLSGGLPTTNFGRTALAIHTTDTSETVYAGVANASTSVITGLYRTTNGGATWVQASTTNYASSQGWYNNIVAVDPTNPNRVFCGGLDAYRSTTGGTSLTSISAWGSGFFGVIPAGGAEGSSNYVHADHHAIAFYPGNPNRIFYGTDGGVFESTDGGTTWAGRNGGYVTTQFYNGFASSIVDSAMAYGGLQDNGTVKYEGTRSWNKEIGGDGTWCATHPTDRNIAFGAVQFLSIRRTTNNGTNWASVAPPSNDPNFIAPYAISPANGNILYAGARNLYRSTNLGTNWTAMNGGNPLNTNRVCCIATSWTNSDTLYVGTGTSISVPNFSNGLVEVFFSANGGTTFTNVTANFGSTGLPNRYPTDLYVNPKNSREVFLTYSGYGTPHVFKSTNCGQNWIDITGNLPDIPVQSVCNDDAYPNELYIGTDLGVYRSLDGGATWSEFMTGMPPAMAIDVSISPMNRSIRVATHGNGVYERRLRPAPRLSASGDVAVKPTAFALEQNYPNPFNPSTGIRYQVSGVSDVRLEVFDMLGRKVSTLVNERQAAGSYQVNFNAANLASGTYLYRLETRSSGSQARSFTETKKMLLVK